ncbi:Hypothetical predicted protein [Paramuricea clavata]|uniref:Uncharacterized protein n=1 Tax=Paramuricea clavata TaxID=317549 RepID=A0A6S7IFL1_PARCT|nr:Hypothetical predicted protein [Paramuricea clavata]
MIFEKIGVDVPSLNSILNFTIEGVDEMLQPQKSLARYPEETDDYVYEMNRGIKWLNDKEFQSSSITVKGKHYYINDIVQFSHNEDLFHGKLMKFYTKATMDNATQIQELRTDGYIQEKVQEIQACPSEKQKKAKRMEFGITEKGGAFDGLKCFSGNNLQASEKLMKAAEDPKMQQFINNTAKKDSLKNKTIYQSGCLRKVKLLTLTHF